MFADPPDLNPDEASHQKPHQHRSRRGRSLNSNNHSSQQYGHFNQGPKPPFSHDYLNYAVHQRPPYQDENGARRRGRGRREGDRSLNGNFGGSGSSWQRPGGDFGPYSGNNQGAYAGAHPTAGPDGPNWRRDAGRSLDQTNEDHDAKAKKPRKFSQEQRRGQQNEKSTRLKENNTTEGGHRSDDIKGETPPSDTRERTQRSRTGPDHRREDHQRKHTDVRRRQGPIKATQPPFQEEMGSESAGAQQEESGRVGSAQHPVCRAGRGPTGRDTPLQARGGRRTHHQNLRPGQRNRDKMPESKETQTG